MEIKNSFHYKIGLLTICLFLIGTCIGFTLMHNQSLSDLILPEKLQREIDYRTKSTVSLTKSISFKDPEIFSKLVDDKAFLKKSFVKQIDNANIKSDNYWNELSLILNIQEKDSSLMLGVKYLLKLSDPIYRVNHIDSVWSQILFYPNEKDNLISLKKNQDIALNFKLKKDYDERNSINIVSIENIDSFLIHIYKYRTKNKTLKKQV